MGNEERRIKAGRPGVSLYSSLGLGGKKTIVTQTKVVEMNMVKIMYIQEVF